ncbi:unnamed protein product, partial [Mesorhabditis spiculigera]
MDTSGFNSDFTESPSKAEQRQQEQAQIREFLANQPPAGPSSSEDEVETEDRTFERQLDVQRDHGSYTVCPVVDLESARKAAEVMALRAEIEAIFASIKTEAEEHLALKKELLLELGETASKCMDERDKARKTISS